MIYHYVNVGFCMEINGHSLSISLLIFCLVPVLCSARAGCVSACVATDVR